jgi:hypothetical protein
MLAATIALLSLAVLAAFSNWRRGIFIAIVVALLQDVLRKLTPDQPAVFVVMVGVVFGAAALGAMMAGIPLAPRNILGWRRYLTAPFGVFVAVLIFQAFNAFAQFGNVVIPLIGLTAYLTPFFAVCLVYQIAVLSRESLIGHVFRFYVVCAFLGLTTIYLQYIGFDWPILGEVGRGLIIFDRDTGAILSAYSGIFRSSEVAAWHAASVVCFFAILIINRRITPPKLLMAAVFVVLVIGLGMVTGRRKFLVEILVFGSSYVALLLYFGRGARLAILAAFIGVMGYFAFVLWAPPEGVTIKRLGGITVHDDKYETYMGRARTVFGDIPDRVAELGVAPISWAYNKYGIFGAGLGTGSQGTAYFGAVAQGSSEGGLGKIWLELGGPGFVVIAWLGWAFTRFIWDILKFLNRQSASLHRVACGLASFLLANLATFLVSTQIYGDMFVLLMLGTALGCLLAMPALASRAALQKRVLNLAPGSLVPRSRHSKAFAISNI